MNEKYYNSQEWERVKEARKKYDGYKCKNCGATKNLQVHHKNYTFEGTENIKDDLITLCANCHYKITMINRKKRKGLI